MHIEDNEENEIQIIGMIMNEIDDGNENGKEERAHAVNLYSINLTTGMPWKLFLEIYK